MTFALLKLLLLLWLLLVIVFFSHFIRFTWWYWTFSTKKSSYPNIESFVYDCLNCQRGTNQTPMVSVHLEVLTFHSNHFLLCRNWWITASSPSMMSIQRKIKYSILVSFFRKTVEYYCYFSYRASLWYIWRSEISRVYH